MPKLRRLSGPDVVKILGQFGFAPLTQRGSHIKVRRVRPEGGKETLTIPNHRELDTGTARAILRQEGGAFAGSTGSWHPEYDPEHRVERPQDPATGQYNQHHPSRRRVRSAADSAGPRGYLRVVWFSVPRRVR